MTKSFALACHSGFTVPSANRRNCHHDEWIIPPGFQQTNCSCYSWIFSTLTSWNYYSLEYGNPVEQNGIASLKFVLIVFRTKFSHFISSPAFQSVALRKMPHGTEDPVCFFVSKEWNFLLCRKRCWPHGGHLVLFGKTKVTLFICNWDTARPSCGKRTDDCSPSLLRTESAHEENPIINGRMTVRTRFNGLRSAEHLPMSAYFGYRAEKECSMRRKCSSHGRRTTVTLNGEYLWCHPGVTSK